MWYFDVMRALAFALLFALPASAAKVTVDVRGLPTPAAAKPLDPEIAQKAAPVFAARCALCHGANGEGDGPSSAMMKPQPRRFSDALWQASVTDEQIRQVILLGGGARKLSTLMLPAPDLKDKPDVLDALVAFIRSRRAPQGTARLTFGAAPARVAIADAVPSDAGGAVRFEVLDVAPGTHPIVVHAVNGEHCKTSAVVTTTDVNVVCSR